jgi:HD-GYP domain-containing protein (c-di-GMP phosphodiesterase class II)
VDDFTQATRDGPALDLAGLFEDTQERAPRRLGRKERRVELAAGVLFAMAAISLQLLFPDDRSFSPFLAFALVGAYAIAARVRFHIGTGYTVPTQPFFIAMLFLLPTSSVPLFVATGFLLADLPDYLRRRINPERAMFAFGDSWHAIGPALVFMIAGIGEADLADWPIYLLALASQFGIDLITITVRERLALGIPARTQLRERGWTYAVDALLSPLGLLVALVEADHPYSFLFIMPLVVLLKIFAREREARIEHAVELSNTYRGTAQLLGDVIEADDHYTGIHSRSIMSLALVVARKMKLDSNQLRKVEFAALLHDVGKISIPKEIINKPGPLDDAEWELVKTHTLEGERMLLRVGGVLAEVGSIVRSCHEHWDGSGYPDGLAGEAIPIEARIVSVCDAFNAMTTTRAYRKGMTTEYALEELRACSGSQFDPRVATELVACVEASLTAEHGAESGAGQGAPAGKTLAPA